ncbi:MAG: hypothetical protein JSV22_07435, partial [Bacteroidales bacterium]
SAKIIEKKGFESQTYYYKEKYYSLYYKFDSDSNLIFDNTDSESNYKNAKKLYENPYLAELFLIGDPTIYIFETHEERMRYLDKRFSIMSNNRIDEKETIERLTKPKKREPINELIKKDSLNAKHISLDIKLEPKKFKAKGILNNLVYDGDNNTEDKKLKSGGWEPDPGAFISLYEHAYYAGASINCIDHGVDVAGGYDGHLTWANGYGIANLSAVNFNDKTSSACFGNPATRQLMVIVWFDANYSGKSWCVWIENMNYNSFKTFQEGNFANWEYRECPIFCPWKNYNDEFSSIEWAWLKPCDGFLTDECDPDWNHKINVNEYFGTWLMKTGASGWMTGAGAITNSAYIWPNYCGAVEATIPYTFNEFMIGLTYEFSSSPYYNTIDYAINNSDYFNNTVRCYKRGSYLVSSGVSYEAGDIIRVERNVNGYINFYLNSI